MTAGSEYRSPDSYRPGYRPTHGGARRGTQVPILIQSLLLLPSACLPLAFRETEGRVHLAEASCTSCAGYPFKRPLNLGILLSFQRDCEKDGVKRCRKPPPVLPAGQYLNHEAERSNSFKYPSPSCPAPLRPESEISLTPLK